MTVPTNANVSASLRSPKGRTYFFPNEDCLVVENVIAFCVSSSGNHRLKIQSDKEVVVKAGWLGLEIVAPKMTVE